MPSTEQEWLQVSQQFQETFSKLHRVVWRENTLLSRHQKIVEAYITITKAGVV
nr:unnamed protein product [Callosobruchus analis]